ncbi:Uncharacterised protein [Mycobacteroides abscessus subsp. abscessus]|nr:Uncharacterised protein [Mycobacteroides abscessus subsp. abscessus]
MGEARFAAGVPAVRYPCAGRALLDASSDYKPLVYPPHGLLRSHVSATDSPSAPSNVCLANQFNHPVAGSAGCVG